MMRSNSTQSEKYEPEKWDEKQKKHVKEIKKIVDNFLFLVGKNDLAELNYVEREVFNSFVKHKIGAN